MAQGENAEKWGRPGKEYWGRRLGPREPSRWAKQITHRLERRAARRECKAAVEELRVEQEAAVEELRHLEEEWVWWDEWYWGRWGQGLWGDDYDYWPVGIDPMSDEETDVMEEMFRGPREPLYGSRTSVGVGGG